MTTTDDPVPTPAPPAPSGPSRTRIIAARALVVLGVLLVMGNPYDDDGERGRQVHERLVQRLDSERDQLVEPSEPSRLEIL